MTEVTNPAVTSGSVLLGEGAWLLRGLALEVAHDLLAEIRAVEAAAPFRNLVTPAGVMSVAMTNCGELGWTSDARGYRYSAVDPQSGARWPAMPATFLRLARTAASTAGFDGFEPQACLVNRYVTGAKMGMHQDRDEARLTEPIVSVSLGLPAIFRWGGLTRAAPASGHLLTHGDVVVWGGPSRRVFHGILPLKAGTHAATGPLRFNLTFRRVN